MQSEPQDFVELRRLLALKRHEQPPPGYFNQFHRQVIARIRAGEEVREESSRARFFLEFPFLAKLWAALEAKPVLAGAFGVAVCGLLTTGFLMSDNATLVQTAPVGVLMPEGTQITTTGLRIANDFRVASPSAISFLNQAHGLATPGTGGVDTIQVRASLFQQPQTLPINFTLPQN